MVYLFGILSTKIGQFMHNELGTPTHQHPPTPPLDQESAYLYPRLQGIATSLKASPVEWGLGRMDDAWTNTIKMNLWTTSLNQCYVDVFKKIFICHMCKWQKDLYEVSKCNISGFIWSQRKYMKQHVCNIEYQTIWLSDIGWQCLLSAKSWQLVRGLYHSKGNICCIMFVTLDIRPSDFQNLKGWQCPLSMKSCQSVRGG